MLRSAAAWDFQTRRLHDYASSPSYIDDERAALEFADRMTITEKVVDDEFFSGCVVST